MAERYRVWREFARLGRELFLAGLNNTHSGNMSLRLDERRLLITRSGSMLGSIQAADLVEVSLEGKEGERLPLPRPSVELPLHRAVYRLTGHRAIVHAHPPALIALSLKNERIVPIDEEGKYYTPEGVPVVSAPQTIGSEEAGLRVARALRKDGGVVLRGHGMFAGGTDLESAAKLISSAEHSARILLDYIVASHAGTR